MAALIPSQNYPSPNSSEDEVSSSSNAPSGNLAGRPVIKVSLPEMPDDLLGIIASCLPPSDICQLRPTCRAVGALEVYWKPTMAWAEFAVLVKQLPKETFTYVKEVVGIPEDIKDADLLALIRAFPRLERLELVGTTSLSVGALQQIGRLTSLRYLDLQRAPVTREVLESLDALTQLEFLDISNCVYLNSGSLVALHPFQQLKELRISESWKWRDSDIDALAPLANLQRLHADDCEYLTPACLESIFQFERLAYLKITSESSMNANPITQAAINEIFREKPGLTVDFEEIDADSESDGEFEAGGGADAMT